MASCRFLFLLPSGTGLQSPTKSLIGDIVSSPQRDPQLESLRANCKQESGIRSDSGCNPDAEPVSGFLDIEALRAKSG